MRLELCAERLEQLEADALLVPVDGRLCRLGGAAAAALRAALPAEERADELEYVEHELSTLRPLAHPEARVIDGVGRWNQLVISAAYPHDVDDTSFSPADCARMIRAALPAALAVAADHGVTSIAAAVIGTAYRMPADLAVRAFVDGAAATPSATEITLRWSLPDPTHRRLAEDAMRRVMS